MALCLWGALVSEEVTAVDPVPSLESVEMATNTFSRIADWIVARARYEATLWRNLWNGAKVFLIRRHVHYFVQVSGNAKCPACGIRKKHKVEWAEAYERVMHACSRCSAHWAESPVASIDLWRVKTVSEPPKQETIGKQAK